MTIGNVAHMNSANAQRSKRGWCRFSLRTLLITMAMLGVGLGIIGNEFVQLRRYRASGKRISQLGGRLVFFTKTGKEPRGPWWCPVVMSGMYAERQVVWFTSGRNAGLRNEDLGVFNELPRLDTVEIVAAGISDEGLAHLEKLTRLRRLVLQDTQVTSKGLHRLKSLPLQQLVMGGEATSSDILDCLGSLKSLKKLALYDAPVTDGSLKNLKHVPELEHLYLEKCQITEEGFREVAHLKKLKIIELLDLNVGDAGIEQLAKLSSLREVDLEKLPITDQGLRALAQLPHLRRLHVTHAATTVDGFHAFEQSGSLRSLMIGPGITPDHIKALRAIMPACKVSDSMGTIRFHGP